LIILVTAARVQARRRQGTLRANVASPVLILVDVGVRSWPQGSAAC
jgi:hypothetical protein